MSIITATTVTNLIGIALIVMISIINRDAFKFNKNMRTVHEMGILVIATCIAELLAYRVDGLPGTFGLIAVYATNTWIYFASVFVMLLWYRFLCNHIGFGEPKAMRIVNTVILAGVIIALILNFFFPIAFTVTGNVYHRGFFHNIIAAITLFYIGVTVVQYFRIKKKSGSMVYFPVWVFILPLTIGIIVQSVFYGISVIWVGAALSITGVVSSLKNELIYIDQMTGINNRYYLEELKKLYGNKRNAEMTAMMMDLNRFKNINDEFGHAVGDQALVSASNNFVKALNGRGKVIRYAGDEFVIILNSVDDAVIEDVISRINSGFEELNNSGEHKYQLSTSIGYSKFHTENQSIDELMNVIDEKMYENKMEYYKEHEKAR